MAPGKHFAVIALPLNRAEVVDFLLPPSRKPKGARLQIVGQRPSAKAEADWIKRLRQTAVASAAEFLTIDDPRHNLVNTHTDRLVRNNIICTLSWPNNPTSTGETLRYSGRCFR